MNPERILDKKVSRRKILKAGMGLGAFAGLTLAGIGCGGESPKNPQKPEPTSTTQVEPQAQQQTENIPVSTTKPSPEPEEQAGPPPVEEAPVQPEPEVTTPQPQAEPENPQQTTPEEEEEILPGEYRSKADVIERHDSNGQVFNIVLLNLPAGVNITSPISGELSKAETELGLMGVVRNPNDAATLTLTIQGDIGFQNMLTVPVEKGGIIATTRNNRIMLSIFGNYNVGFGMTRIENGKIVDASDELQKFFPEAFEKGPVKIFGASGNGTTYTTPTYSH